MREIEENEELNLNCFERNFNLSQSSAINFSQQQNSQPSSLQSSQSSGILLTEFELAKDPDTILSVLDESLTLEKNWADDGKRLIEEVIKPKKCFACSFGLIDNSVIDNNNDNIMNEEFIDDEEETGNYRFEMANSSAFGDGGNTESQGSEDNWIEYPQP